MGLRKTLNRNSTVVTIATIVVIAAMVGLIVWQTWPSGPPRMSGEVFYSVDDGKSWFADSRDRVPPFDHEGKPAVLAHVFTCNDGKDRFVGYLERYTAETQKLIADAKAKAQGGAAGQALDPDVLNDMMQRGTEVKKANDPKAAWVRQSDPNYMKVISVQCPDRMQGAPTMVVP